MEFLHSLMVYFAIEQLCSRSIELWDNIEYQLRLESRQCMGYALYNSFYTRTSQDVLSLVH